MALGGFARRNEFQLVMHPKLRKSVPRPKQAFACAACSAFGKCEYQEVIRLTQRENTGVVRHRRLHVTDRQNVRVNLPGEELVHVSRCARSAYDL